MGIINLLRALMPLFKDSKTFLGVVACSAVLGQWLVGYVDAKHKDGIAQLKSTQEQVLELKQREYQTMVMLRAIESNLNVMGDRFRVMDQRIWELYRDSKQSKIEAQYSDE